MEKSVENEIFWAYVRPPVLIGGLLLQDLRYFADRSWTMWV